MMGLLEVEMHVLRLVSSCCYDPRSRTNDPMTKLNSHFFAVQRPRQSRCFTCKTFSNVILFCDFIVCEMNSWSRKLTFYFGHLSRARSMFSTNLKNPPGRPGHRFCWKTKRFHVFVKKQTSEIKKKL